MKSKSGKAPQIKKARIHDVKNNVILLKDSQGRPYRGVEPKKNHHIEIYEYTDSKGVCRRDGKVVSLFEAVKRAHQGLAVVQKEHGEGTCFVCSLCINDTVLLKDKDGDEDLYRVQKMSKNKQIYFRHHTAATIDNETTVIRKQASLFDGQKVTVDPIGRIHKAND